MANPPLEISVLGKPLLNWQGQPLTVEQVSSKGLALLVYLALSGRPCSRQAVSGLLWGDLPEERARGNLRFTLNKLRVVLGDVLLTDRAALALEASLCRVDVAQFIAHCAAPEKADYDAMQSALDLYRGDFLDDFYLREAPDFETWTLVERERLQQMAIAALFHLSGIAQKRMEWEKAIVFTRRILVLEAWREEAHRQLMSLLAESGQRSAALNQYETCRKALADELGVEPAPETTALYERIKNGEFAGAEKPDSAPRPAPVRGKFTPRDNLPLPLTTFIGREAELAQIAERLSDMECRCLTLVGPGGVGKTRLALAAARQQSAQFPDGVRFVSLREMNPSGAAEAVELLVASIAGAFDYTFSAPRSPRALLAHHLAGKEALILLDNFEPVLSPRLDARPEMEQFLAELLQVCPALKLLVTSRERLGFAPEWLLEVRGLPCALDPERESPTGHAAGRLFLQGARRIQPGFPVVGQERSINRICQLVDGFPLAIELAANWVRLLSCADIAERLERGLELLAPGPGEARASMRSVLDSSWEMLDEQERSVFRRLSVFREGFTLTAAQHVADASLPVLNRLLNKSMLRREDDGRYALHELLSQHGAARLAEFPADERETRLAHSRFYSGLLQARCTGLSDELEHGALAAVEAEIGNVRAALERQLAGGEVELLARNLDCLLPFYQRKGWFQEMVFLLEQACALEYVSSVQRGTWLRWLGDACYHLGKFPESVRRLEQALALLDRPLPAHSVSMKLSLLRQMLRQGWQRLRPARVPSLDEREAQSRREAVLACERLAQVYWFQSRPERLNFVAARALNLAETLGESPALARICSGMGIGMGLAGLHPAAEFYMRRALTMAQGQGSRSALATVEENAALYFAGRGLWNRAMELLQDAAACARQVGDQRRWEECVGLQGVILSLRGRFAESLALQEETVASARQRGDMQFQFHELSGLAENTLRLGRLDEALAYLEEAAGLLPGGHGWVEEIRFYGIQAQARWQQGEWALAHRAAYLAGERIQKVQPAAFYSLEGYAGAAEAYLALWEREPAEGPEFSQFAGQACRALLRFSRAFPIGEPRALLHQGRLYWLTGSPQKARAAWQAGLSAAQRLGMPYEQARAHDAIGRYLSDVGHLQLANESFAQLNIPCAIIRE